MKSLRLAKFKVVVGSSAAGSVLADTTLVMVAGTMMMTLVMFSYVADKDVQLEPLEQTQLPGTDNQQQTGGGRYRCSKQTDWNLCPHQVEKAILV